MTDDQRSLFIECQQIIVELDRLEGTEAVQDRKQLIQARIDDPTGYQRAAGEELRKILPAITRC